MGWNHPANQFVPWFHELSLRLSRTPMPSLAGERLWISSDYSFDTEHSDFDVVSFLIVDIDNSPGWHEGRRYVRDKYLPDSRRLSWKRLSDRMRQDAFFPFLSAADCLEGLAISVAIERDPVFKLTTKELLDEYRGRPWLKANWKQPKAEQMILVAYTLAFLVAGLSRRGQCIDWVSDDDALFANESFHLDTGNTFTRLLSAFSSHDYGEIAIGTAAGNGPDLHIEDLNFIPDLMAGATSEFFTAMKRQHGVFTGDPVAWPVVSERGCNFLSWYLGANHPLKKRMCVLARNEKGRPCGSLLKFEGEADL